MSTTNRERVAASRARSRAKLGETEYKRREAVKRAERRRLKRLEQQRSSSEEKTTPSTEHREDLQALIGMLQSEISEPRRTIPEIKAIVKQKADIKKIRSEADCNALFNSVYKAKVEKAEAANRTVSMSSVRTQFNRVQNIYKRLFNKPMDCSNFEWTRDTKKVIDFIQSGKRWKTLTSQNSQFSALASVLGVLKDYTKEYKIYSDISTLGAKDILETASDIKMSEKERQNFVKWINLRNLYKKKTDNLEHRALVGLLTLLPPRRNQDYQYLTLANSRDGMKNDFNYLLLDSRGDPDKLIYNRYKTSKTFGTQEYDIPINLAGLLISYIKTKKIGNGKPLFQTRSGGYYKNFTDKITEAFRTYIDKDITINILRHSWIQEFLKRKRTPKNKKAMADAMAHSIWTQSLYDRIDN